MAKRIVRFQVNGESVEILCEPRQSLLEVLRNTLELTGSKEGCNNGNCGACTVILDDRVVNSCLVLAVEVEGKSVRTIEGIAQGGNLTAVQTKFLEHAALQCGICTPGFIVAAEVEGKSVRTIEGIAQGGNLTAVQTKFLEHAALQCGICTPGFIVAAEALLTKNPNPSEHDVRLGLAGNLCRCTGYDKIVRAVLDAAAVMRQEA